jgi:hypothetical protein
LEMGEFWQELLGMCMEIGLSLEVL